MTRTRSTVHAGTVTLLSSIGGSTPDSLFSTLRHPSTMLVQSGTFPSSIGGSTLAYHYALGASWKVHQVRATLMCLSCVTPQNSTLNTTAMRSSTPHAMDA